MSDSFKMMHFSSNFADLHMKCAVALVTALVFSLLKLAIIVIKILTTIDYNTDFFLFFYHKSFRVW